VTKGVQVETRNRYDSK